MAAEPTSTPAHQSPDLSSLCLAITGRAPLPMAAMEGASHVVRYVNPAFCRLMGKPTEQLVGKPLREMLPDKGECVTLLDRVFRTGKPESNTEEQHSKHPVFWSYTIWPVLADERPVGVMIQVTETTQFHEKTLAMNEALMLGSVRQHELTEVSENLNALLHVEIAERKRTEEALRRAQAQLTDRAGHLEGLVAERTAELITTNKQLEAFVYSIAHDLRAPLRSMQGFATALVEEAGVGLSEKARGFAQRISASAQFLDALLRDLLAFSRVNQQRIELVPVNLQTVVQAVLFALEKEIQEKNARVEIVGPLPVVLVHEPTLGQVLFNLLRNALKFVAPEVQPHIRIWAEEGIDGLMDERINADQPSTHPPIHSSSHPAPPSQPTPGFVRVWVEDNGIGIASEHQEQVFGLFTRLHGEKYPGTGIGLTIVQKGVGRMGGRVGVDSTPGQGSRFWFELQKPGERG
jgi:signal transduction histidine kinase